MNAIGNALYSRLQTTSALTTLLAGTTAIYHLRAPEGQAYPYVVFSIQGGGDMNMTAHRHKNLVYNIRAYSADSALVAGSIDNAIDGALHLNPLTVSGWSNIWLAREQDIETVENAPSGLPIYMAGGLYRIRIDK